jgi:SAM-dependent methyltransferase
VTGTRESLYPEVAAGGFTRHDGFVDFYVRVGSLIDNTTRVLDFGAGRGEWADGRLSDFHREIRDFRGRAKEVVGVDVDPVVLENATLDRAHVITAGEPLPFEPGSFDLVVADHVLEHVAPEDAPAIVAELERVLAPGGWFAARTPNKWGMIGVGARVVPNRLHVAVLRGLQPGRLAKDVFPTRYAMNTRKHLKRLFAANWDLYVYGHASEPQYAGQNAAAWRVAAFIDRLTPPRMLPTLMIFARRR